jgi:hypothetical protein
MSSRDYTTAAVLPSSGQRATLLAERVRLPSLYLMLWALYPILFPFYLIGRDSIAVTQKSVETITWAPKLEGGVPQAADYLLVGLIALVGAGIGLSLLPSMTRAVWMFGLFAAYVTLVNLLWGALLEDPSLWKNSLFYIYNYVVFVTFVILYSRFKERLLWLTVHAVAASVFLQTLLSPFIINWSWDRQTLFFHNENQLGYFALLAASVFCLGTKYFEIRTWYQVLFYAAVIYLGALSVSKAAIAGIILLAALALLDRPSRLLLGALLSAGLLVVTAVLPADLAPGFVGGLEQRVAVQRVDDTWEGRGYDRLVNHPEYLILGAGEGAYTRFQSVLPSELHSSFGTLLFCYGIVGAVLFVSPLIVMCRPRPLLVLYLLPTCAYGMAHQGLRSSLFWVLLAFLYCLARRWASSPAYRRAIPIRANDTQEAGVRSFANGSTNGSREAGR